MNSLQMLISGGQSGVDRAALDVAMELGLHCGGWCPKGRKAEDGPLPARYPMRETPSASYAVRTKWNVRDSDATLILTRGTPTGGTALTISCARTLQRPVLIQRLGPINEQGQRHIQTWLAENHVRVLNVAGPRESSSQGIYKEACEFLKAVCNPVQVP